MDSTTKNCLNCNTSFTRRLGVRAIQWAEQKFCSHQCSYIFKNSEWYQDANNDVRVCLNCNATFTRQKQHVARFRQRKFCSWECSRLYKRRERYDDQGNKQCCECQQWKPISSFHLMNNGATTSIRCKPCGFKTLRAWGHANKDKVLLAQRRRRNDLHKKLKVLLVAARSRAKANGIPFDLTADHVFNLWETQKGLCFYTDEPMTNINGRGKSDTNVSLDRMNPILGYTQGNVVLCQRKINTIKQDLTADEFYSLAERILAIRDKR